MPSPSVAYEVDDHISLEGISKIHRQLGNKNYRFRVVGVDMENRRLDHFGDIGAALERASSLRLVVNPTWLLRTTCRVPPVL